MTPAVVVAARRATDYNGFGRTGAWPDRQPQGRKMGINANIVVLLRPQGGSFWLFVGILLAALAWLQSQSVESSSDEIRFEMRREKSKGHRPLGPQPTEQ